MWRTCGGQNRQRGGHVNINFWPRRKHTQKKKKRKQVRACVHHAAGGPPEVHRRSEKPGWKPEGASKEVRRCKRAKRKPSMHAHNGRGVGDACDDSQQFRCKSLEEKRDVRVCDCAMIHQLNAVTIQVGIFYFLRLSFCDLGFKPLKKRPSCQARLPHTPNIFTGQYFHLLFTHLTA